ncbi:MAG TPA: protein kinase [Blastocatellia bacterium]|nr:protein kinase [Blastocatellia bacterium]
MKPERWKQIDQLLEAALERPPGQRAALLDAACGGDEALRSEVEALIRSDEQAASFMEAPAFEVGAGLLVEDKSDSLVGQRLGPYRVLSLIGKGGMGEVYLAQDSRLGRKVALKLLPASFTRDEERVRRFRQEARAASALNHPNILTIFEIGQVDGLHFIATEFIEGQTLRQRIANEGMRLGEACDVAIQVVSALAAAHRAGIIHRDLKPENVMVRTDGYVKVVDFGLAKLAKRQVEATRAESKIPATVETGSGVVLGTPSYMSPEQARGLAVDTRTDIWSLGVVLYEMITGRAPFAGATTSDVIVSILEREPAPLAQLSPDTPAELQRVVSKALRKDREERYQDIKEMLVDLKSLKQNVDVTPARGARPWWRAQSLLVLLAGAALAISTLAWFYFPRPGANSTMPMMPPMKTVPFTSFPGREEWPAFSPDGKQLAFSWNGEKEENFDIYVKLINAGTPLRLTTHPGMDSSPTWSPDGRYIAFSRFDKGESGIYMVPALGGPERKLLSFETEWFVRDPPIVVWSPDGKYLAFTDKHFLEGSTSILLLSIENLEKRRLMSPPAQYQYDWHPAFSPDGQTLAFTRWIRHGVGDIYLVPIRGGEPKRLTFDNLDIGGLAWTADGQSIVFLSSRGGVGPRLWKIPAAGGTPEPLAISSHHPWPRIQFSISRQGHRLAYSVGLGDKNIWRMEVPGSEGQPTSPVKLISSSLDDWGAQFSPDGKRFAFESWRSGTPQVWVCDREGSNPIQLTSIGESFSGRAYGSGSALWSPDGRQIAFDASVEVNNVDIRHIHVVNAEGGPPRRITTGAAYDGMPSWSRDGRWIYFASNRSGDWQVWKVPAEGGEAVQVTKNGGFRACESPDGKFIYYSKVDASGLWRVPVEGGEESLILDQLQKGYFHAWAVVDRGIYFINPAPKPPATIEFFSFATRRITRIASLEKVSFMWGSTLAISPDERWILYSQLDQTGSDIMLVENFR